MGAAKKRSYRMGWTIFFIIIGIISFFAIAHAGYKDGQLKIHRQAVAMGYGKFKTDGYFSKFEWNNAAQENKEGLSNVN
jgi:hypothetical protein